MQKPLSSRPRFVATKVLETVFSKRIPAADLLDRECHRASLSPRDRRLAYELVFGVLRHRQELDSTIQQLSTVQRRKLDPFVHQCLAVGIYQILFLDKIPDSATVNEMVNCCRAAGKPQKVCGFVNANLRNCIRKKTTLSRELAAQKEAGKLVNHPQWLISRWENHFGKQATTKICRANATPSHLTIRTNTSRISVKDLQRLFRAGGHRVRRGNYSDIALVLEEFQGPISDLPGYREGYFQVQGEAAQLATTLLFPLKQDGRYLDCCAGLGGKTSHLLQAGDTSRITLDAVEPSPKRVARLKDNLTRLFGTVSGRIHPATLQNCATHLRGGYDGILLDAPCSGTGVIGRHPDIRWNRREEDLERFKQTQLELLELAAKLLRPGGVLVYATCSLEPEENIQVINSFLDRQREFRLDPCATLLPASCQQFIVDGCFHPLPDGDIEGFFGARLCRTT